VLFVNGLPLAVMELKNAADEDATIWTAFQQLQTASRTACSGVAALAFARAARFVAERPTVRRQKKRPWRSHLEGFNSAGVRSH
jgi:type I site-specific restriction-modification system R (restriction) subunit